MSSEDLLGLNSVPLTTQFSDLPPKSSNVYSLLRMQFATKKTYSVISPLPATVQKLLFVRENKSY
jgi:hypothetical protein